jgi:hypothetical protein
MHVILSEAHLYQLRCDSRPPHVTHGTGCSQSPYANVPRQTPGRIVAQAAGPEGPFLPVVQPVAEATVRVPSILVQTIRVCAICTQPGERWA